MRLATRHATQGIDTNGKPQGYAQLQAPNSPLARIGLSVDQVRRLALEVSVTGQASRSSMKDDASLQTLLKRATALTVEQVQIALSPILGRLLVPDEAHLKICKKIRSVWSKVAMQNAWLAIKSLPGALPALDVAFDLIGPIHEKIGLRRAPKPAEIARQVMQELDAITNPIVRPVSCSTVVPEQIAAPDQITA